MVCGGGQRVWPGEPNLNPDIGASSVNLSHSARRLRCVVDAHAAPKGCGADCSRAAGVRAERNRCRGDTRLRRAPRADAWGKETAKLAPDHFVDDFGDQSGGPTLLNEDRTQPFVLSTRTRSKSPQMGDPRLSTRIQMSCERLHGTWLAALQTADRLGCVCRPYNPPRGRPRGVRANARAQGPCVRRRSWGTSYCTRNTATTGSWSDGRTPLVRVSGTFTLWSDSALTRE
jgi:hypothetical protein